jgi:hypothetical protein
MPRPPTAPVATPGVPSVAPADDTDGDQVTGRAAGLDDTGGAPNAGSQAPSKTLTLTMTQAELQAMLNQAAAQGAAAVHRAAAPRAAPEADLPDQSEIDPAKITSPTLSRQGYVVPLHYGEPANPAIKR